MNAFRCAPLLKQFQQFKGGERNHSAQVRWSLLGPQASIQPLKYNLYVFFHGLSKTALNPEHLSLQKLCCDSVGGWKNCLNLLFSPHCFFHCNFCTSYRIFFFHQTRTDFQTALLKPDQPNFRRKYTSKSDMKVKTLLTTYIHGSIPTYIMCFLPLSSYKLIQIHRKKISDYQQNK